MQLPFLTIIATILKKVDYKILIKNEVINELIHVSMTIIFQSFSGRKNPKLKKKMRIIIIIFKMRAQGTITRKRCHIFLQFLQITLNTFSRKKKK